MARKFIPMANWLGLTLGSDRDRQAVALYRLHPLWRIQFWLEKAWLSLGLGNRVLGIEHVGSTSIYGLPAKPIVDISVAVEHYEQAWGLVPLLKNLGYEYLGENSERCEYAFKRRGLLACAVFICEPGGEKWQGRLRFRDYLRSHPEARRTYATLKQSLAKRFPDDLLAYQRAKLPFVQDILTLSKEIS